MASIETLEQMFRDNKELSIIQHQSIIEKIDNISHEVIKLEKKFDCKIVELEESSKEFQSWKNYVIAIIVIIGFITPVVAQYLFR